MTGFELGADMLAQYRGCQPDNYCYDDCVDAARSTLNGEFEDLESRAETACRLEEIRDASAWASRQKWVPSRSL